MKRLLSIILSIAVTAAANGMVLAESTEFIVNSGFDEELYGEGNWRFSEPGGWYTEGVVTKTEDTAKGGAALINNGMIYRRVSLKKGVTYRLSFYAKAESECDMTVSFYDGAQEWPAINSVSDTAMAVGTEWSEKEVEFEAPETQDYVAALGLWEDTGLYIDDASLSEVEAYISRLRTGVDGEGAISFQAEYTRDSTLIVALYDESEKLLGCKAQSSTGSFEPVDEYGTYTVKVFLLGDGDVPERSKACDVVYNEESAENESRSIGPAKELTLSADRLELSVGGEDGTLDAGIFPEYAYNKNVTWTSSDSSVAVVSSNGIVTPVGAGSAVITASIGELSDTCTVEVRGHVPVEEITLNKSAVTLPEIDSVYPLTADVLPSNASNKKIIWTSDDENVVRVTDGVVEAVGEGSATVTAVSADGSHSAKCKITVQSSDNTITNDTFYTDTDGNHIYSQGGGIFKFGDKYYWYGVKYKEAPIYASAPENGIAGNAVFDAFTCYSSTDLVNWEFEGYPMSRETAGMEDAGWVGRMGVAYNENTKKYVLISQYAPGMMFATSDTPEGPYKFEHVISDVDYFVNGTTGDQTVFQDDDGKAYVICSSTSGREYMYVAPLRESDFLDIDADRVKEIYHDAEGQYTNEDGQIAVKDKKGIEGNCMFKHNGNYYFTGSDLYGWNSSRVYVLQSDSILGDYNAETGIPYIMPGTAKNYAHNSQAGFYVTVHGSEQELVIYCGDRWGDFAGNGIGYNQWVPITMDENGVPHFNDLHQWKLDAEKGTWTVGEGNNYISNPEFEADRIEVPSPVGWEAYDNIEGEANGNISGKRFAGNFVWQQSADEDYTACLSQTAENLPDGTYTLRAWVKSSGGQNICKLYAESGGVEKNASLKTPIGEWTEIVVSNDIEVKDGKCEIGLYSDAPAGAWVQIDDLSLVKNIE